MPFKNPHPLYSVWQGMRRRCLTPTTRQWEDYGGRGIKICPEWDDFHRFAADMGPKPTPQHSLDRIDNDGDYSPDNCRWATRLEQSRNQRNNWRVTIDGKEYLVCELANRFHIKHETIRRRALAGMTFDQVTAKTVYAYKGAWRKAVATRVANQLAKTHCKHGHAWTPENTGWQKGGARRCKACHRIKMRLRYAKQRADKA